MHVSALNIRDVTFSFDSGMTAKMHVSQWHEHGLQMCNLLFK
jgi:hypothetical protein